MKDAPFELEWASVYTFACLRMDRFRHGRVLFAGDAAHGVSPFGARGANSGVQDAENLAWKLAAVLPGQAPDALLDSYAHEREYAADENIRNSTRATDFITPKSEISRLFRDAVLDWRATTPFARALVNSGRLSVPATLHGSPLNTPDADAFDGRDGARRAGGSTRRCTATGATAGCCARLAPRFTAAASSAPTTPPCARCGKRRRPGAAAGAWRAARAIRCTRRTWSTAPGCRAALRPPARHRLPAAARPARVRALAPRRRCGARALRRALALH